MLGVAYDAADPTLDPSYDLTAQEIYTNVTRYLFSKDRRLTFYILLVLGILRV